MNRAFKVIGTIYASSLLLAGATAIAHRFVAAAVLAAPALLLAFLAFAGHLVTLDDDYPGEWSNPEGARVIWHSSLRQLAAKFAALLVASVVFAVAAVLAA